MPTEYSLLILLLTLLSALSPLNFDHRLPKTVVIKLKPEPSPLIKTHHLPFVQIKFQQQSSPGSPFFGSAKKKYAGPLARVNF